jgi:hypothetical protein
MQHCPISGNVSTFLSEGGIRMQLRGSHFLSCAKRRQQHIVAKKELRINGNLFSLENVFGPD